MPTANNRVYSRAVLEEAHRADKFPMIGYGQHDTDSLSEAVVNWTDWDIEDEWVMLEGVLLESAPGTQPLVESLQNGVRMGVSMRARGTMRRTREGHDLVTALHLQSYDLTNDPGNAGAHIFLESRSNFEVEDMPKRNEEEVEEEVREAAPAPEDKADRDVAEVAFYKEQALRATRGNTMRKVPNTPNLSLITHLTLPTKRIV